MLRQRFKKREGGQVILEYTLVIGAVILALFASGTLIKRGTQGMIKAVADQIGNQTEAEQRFDESGHLVQSYTSSRSSTVKDISEDVTGMTYGFTESTNSVGSALVNLGYTEEP